MSFDNYLKLLVIADKDASITAVTVTPVPTKFTLQLTEGYNRKLITAYNNSNSASGECYYGFSASISEGSGSQPIPKGAMVDIPVADCDAIDLYFVAASGEIGDLRVSEYA